MAGRLDSNPAPVPVCRRSRPSQALPSLQCNASSATNCSSESVSSESVSIMMNRAPRKCTVSCRIPEAHGHLKVETSFFHREMNGNTLIFGYKAFLLNATSISFLFGLSPFEKNVDSTKIMCLVVGACVVSKSVCSSRAFAFRVFSPSAHVVPFQE